MKTLRLALDWTPNTNHTGFYVAAELGTYRESDIELIISHPGNNNYSQTPARSLIAGGCDLALAPTESLFAYNAGGRSPGVTAIGAVLQSDASALAVCDTVRFTRPKDLDQATYGSYEAKYEDHIIRALIQADGGTGDISITYPNKLCMWETLESGGCDATWIFEPWEGLLRRTQGKTIQTFHLSSWDIPYSYSPVILATTPWATEHDSLLRNFMRASEIGWQRAKENPREAAEILLPHVPEGPYRELGFLTESVTQICTHAFADDTWGSVLPGRVKQFRDWLCALSTMPPHYRAELQELTIEKLVVS